MIILEIVMAGIKFVSQDFILSDINPFTGMKYDDKWVYMELTETEELAERLLSIPAITQN